MGWKNLPKGGLWGIGVALIISILFGSVIKNTMFSADSIFNFFLSPGLILNIVLNSLLGGNMDRVVFPIAIIIILSVILSIIIWFILGALIGFIVGKIRKRK